MISQKQFDILYNLLDQKKFDHLVLETEKLLKKINYNDIKLLEFKGLGLFGLSRYQESEIIFKNALKIDSNSYTSNLHLARINHLNKNFLKSDSFYKKTTSLNKNNFFIHIEYASFLLDIGNLKDSLKTLEFAKNLNKEHYLSYSLIGKIFLKSEKYEDAIKNFKKSLDIEPKNYKDFNELGYCFYKQEKLKDARQYFEKSIELNPNFYVPYANLGLVYQTMGEIDNAQDYYLKAISIAPNDAENYRLLSLSKNFSKENDIKIIQNMKNIFLQSGENDNKLKISFALSKAMDDLKNFEKSSEYLLIGNSLKRKKYEKYDFKKNEEQFDLLKKTFSKDFFKKKKSIDFKTKETPIFILGMPRSGTTLVEQILSNHSKVYGCGEINSLVEAVNASFPEKDSKKMLKDVSQANEDIFLKIGKDYIKDLRKNSESNFYTDKQPFNFKLIGFIKLSLPNAKIIHCFRNPNDNLISLFQNFFSSEAMIWSYDQIEAKKYYKIYNDLMRHYNNIFDDFIYNLKYENLTNSPKDEVLKILKFCNLDFEQSCLDIKNNNKPIFTASINQARSEINKGSHMRWKGYAEYLPDLFFNEQELKNLTFD